MNYSSHCMSDVIFWLELRWG